VIPPGRDRLQRGVARLAVDVGLERGAQMDAPAGGGDVEIRKCRFRPPPRLRQRAPYLPFEESIPPIPWSVARLAWLNSNWPASGVSAGSSASQGPNSPWVTIVPAGMGLASLASNRIGLPNPADCKRRRSNGNSRGNFAGLAEIMRTSRHRRICDRSRATSDSRRAAGRGRG